jgi:phosphatidylserine/phosphatidylglycerophosphate/cardiolipin synthase-like enzyme
VPPPVEAREPSRPALLLVESSPVETTLDHPDIPDAKDVWPELIARATRSLDLAHFYASNAPGSSLERVVQAIEAAAARGVAVRFLAEEKFYKSYPDTLERLAKVKGIEVRRYHGARLLGGDGILHAKYFIVDGREVFQGSQNFDWRALEHIQELGTDILQPALARAFQDVFDTDWALAGGADRAFRVRTEGPRFPVTVDAGGESLQVTPVFSPKGFLPDESLWDLPRLVQLIDGSRGSVRVQVLTYRAAGRDGAPWDELEGALKRAAGRGVEVKLLVSHWALRGKTLPGLKALSATPGIQIRVMTIPPWSGGDIPFARVVHAKYLSVDGARAWVGTSNWEKDYFYDCRNVGLVLEGPRFAARLERYFEDGWTGPYAAPLSQAAQGR